MVCNIMLNPNPKSKDEKRNKLSPPSSILTLQDFFFRETNFYFCQFLSNFLKYSSSNFPLSYLYSIFAINFSGNSSFLKSFSSAISNFSCLLTSVFILPLNSSNTSLAFPNSSLFTQESCSAVNHFHHTKYLSTPLIFLLFSIFSISHSLTPSISIGFPSSFFCPSTCSLYHTIQLMFTTRWISYSHISLSNDLFFGLQATHLPFYHLNLLFKSS